MKIRYTKSVAHFYIHELFITHKYYNRTISMQFRNLTCGLVRKPLDVHTALCDRTGMSIKCPFTITHPTIG